MKMPLKVMLLGLLLGIAGCGGGGNTLSGSGGTPSGSNVATLTVTSSATSVASDGSTSATVTATAVNSANVAVAGAAVAFSVSNGGVLAVTQGTTDSNGVATATVKASTASAGSALTVSATVGTVKGSISISVVSATHSLALTTNQPQVPSDSSRSATITALLRDANNNALPNVTVSFQSNSGVVVVTQAQTDSNGLAKATVAAGTDPTNRPIQVTATAAEAATATVEVDVVGSTLAMSGAAVVVGGSSTAYSIALRDAGGHGIAGQTVTVASAAGNVISPSSVTTDANGNAAVTLTGTIVGADTLTATGLGMVATRALSVSSQAFTISQPLSGQTIPLGMSQTVGVLWQNNGVPVAGTQVSFATTRGSVNPVTATTDANGIALTAVTSTTAGPAILSASATGVSAQDPVYFIATTPSQVAVQASPATLATQGSSTITAIVRDPQNNPVEGQEVDFSLTDPTGGTVSVASAATDAQGLAQTVYTAGAITSGANGVTVTASVRGTGVSGQTTLTVGGQTVFLSLGTGNTVASPNSASYSISYVVYAVDSTGAPVAGAPVTFKVLPVAYTKGQRAWSAAVSSYTTVVSTLPGAASCANEDVDYTGIYSLAKDYNGNGKLDPGNIAVVSPGSATTGADGSLLVSVAYPKDHAYYVQVQLVATSTVAGTESSAASTFWLPYAASDFNQQSVSPPGPQSPYGTATTCASPN